MRYLIAEERQQVGPYYTPQGYYEYTKTLPFLGTVKSDVKRLVAGEWTEITIVYEVGASGLADGAWIKGTFKFYSVGIPARLNTTLSANLKADTGLGSVSNI